MSLKPSLLISLLGIIFGLLIAIFFGVNESYFKNKIHDGILKNKKYQSIQLEKDQISYMEKESSKNWRYYQRFHFHASAIGAMSLAMILLLFIIDTALKTKIILSYFISISGFLYPFVWLFAAIFGPEWGRSVAKESFALFGYMGGVYLLSSCFLFFILIKNKLIKLT